jgi:hypothetical protein
MQNFEFVDGNGAGLGVDLTEVRSAARRQLVASMVVAVMIAAMAALIAMKPASQDLATAADGHRVAMVEQPTFVIAHPQRVAAMAPRSLELP